MKRAFEHPEKKARTEEVPYVLLLFQDNKYFFMHPLAHQSVADVFTRASALVGAPVSCLSFCLPDGAASAIWGPLGPLPPPPQCWHGNHLFCGIYMDGAARISLLTLLLVL